MKKFICKVCGYVHEGNTSPEFCPKCKAPASAFEEVKTLKGSKTEANLQAAFAGESQATNKYTYFASKAKKDGYMQIAAIFEETAKNEREHAKMWYKLLNGGEISGTEENLRMASGDAFCQRHAVFLHVVGCVVFQVEKDRILDFIRLDRREAIFRLLFGLRLV